MKLDSGNQEIKKRYFYSRIHQKEVSINDLAEFFYEDFIMSGMVLKDFVCRMERGLIIQALFQFDGCQKKASDFLGLKQTTMNLKCKKYKIDISNTIFF